MLLSSIVPSLKNKTLVLASGSKRRKDLLSKLGVQFKVCPSNFPEDLDKSEYVGRPDSYVVDNSRLKALEVVEKRNKNGELVIGCDTVVVFQENIIEKPKDRADAVRILERLSGVEHSVYTGVTLAEKSGVADSAPRLHSFCERTSVRFMHLSAQVIKAYVDSGEPLDKAGAYGIQDTGSLLVERVDGDYFNVVGLPLCRLAKELHIFTSGN